MDNVACVGTESRLDNCSYDATHNCYHFEDAGVICKRMCVGGGSVCVCVCVCVCVWKGGGGDRGGCVRGVYVGEERCVCEEGVCEEGV